MQNAVGERLKLGKKFTSYLSGCRIKLLKQKSPILYQGEIPKYGYFVKKGVIKAYDIGSVGDEKIVALSNGGEFIPPAWVFNKSPVSLYYYEAFTDCLLYIIDREKIQKLINNDFELTKSLFEKYTGLYIGAIQQINALEQSKSTAKIAYIMQHLITKFGKRIDSDKRLISLRLTHQDIASMTGLTRETTSTELNSFKKKGILSYNDQHYVVSVSKLQSLFGSEEFINFRY